MKKLIIPSNLFYRLKRVLDERVFWKRVGGDKIEVKCSDVIYKFLKSRLKQGG